MAVLLRDVLCRVHISCTSKWECNMFDSHNRNINYLRVSVTDRCNLRCLYCMPKDGVSLTGHSDILRYEEIITVVKEAIKLGITKVRVTGGEPLVRKGILDFIAELSALKGIEDISLTTNGILLADFAAPLAQAGIKRINVSLDSLNNKKYAQITGGGELMATLAGIASAQTAGITPIKVNAVAIKGFNDDEVLDFARFAFDNPFQVRFIEFMPLGNAKLVNLGEFMPNEEIKNKIESCYKLYEINRGSNETSGPAQLFAIEGGRGTLGFISPLSHSFCNSCNRLRLTANGNLRACLLSDNEVNIRTAISYTDSSDNEQSALQKLMQSVIYNKPQAHRVTPTGFSLHKCQKEMFQIGG